MNKKP